MQKGPDVPLPLGNKALVYSDGLNHWTDQPTHNAALFTDGTGTLLNNKEAGFGAGGNLAAGTGSFTANVSAFPVSLITDLTTATGTSINQLRQAFQIQKLYEKEARGGSRYKEILMAHFNVKSPDSRLQRPEYLGGCRVPINIHQVVQNSATDSVSPQGNTTAYSLTIDSHSDFTKSFTEHGYVLGLCCVRYDHSYQQGIERMWSRKVKEDFFFPVLANIGEQAILNKEIYAQGSTVIDSGTGKPYDEEVFGYQEAWAEYRYKPSRIAGQLRSTYSTSLDLWHLGDDYSSLPRLSDAWIREDATTIDRTLAVASTVSHQFIADIYVKNSHVRPMPLYSIPGLIDHH